MATMQEGHRRQLTAGVLRLSKAALDLTPDCLIAKSPVVSWAGQVEASAINSERGWDGNKPFVSAKTSILRTMLTACQHGLALYDLARSPRGYSVALATLTRASVEAFARVDWLLSAQTSEEFIGRHASLEYSDLRHPQNHDQALQIAPPSPRSGLPVTAYRQSIRDYAASHELALEKCGPADLANRLLAQIYNEPELIYSGLSGTAHGMGWATTNFFSVNRSDLVPDDQMLIEYCSYVIEITTKVCDRLIDVFVPAAAVVDRWTQIRDQVNLGLSGFISARYQLLS